MEGTRSSDTGSTPSAPGPLGEYVFERYATGEFIGPFVSVSDAADVAIDMLGLTPGEATVNIGKISRKPTCSLFDDNEVEAMLEYEAQHNWNMHAAQALSGALADDAARKELHASLREAVLAWYSKHTGQLQSNDSHVCVRDIRKYIIDEARNDCGYKLEEA